MFKSIDGGLLPQRATKYSAGFDVFANENVVIGAGETKLIGLGICLDLKGFENERKKSMAMNDQLFMESHYFMLCLRSSLGVKGLILPNGHGVIDMDYTGEIKMIIHNPFSNKHLLSFEEITKIEDLDSCQIKKGDKIGQLILCKHGGWLLPAEYTKDEERTGGFGSTNG